jgi:hypothetical protein
LEAEVGDLLAVVLAVEDLVVEEEAVASVVLEAEALEAEELAVAGNQYPRIFKNALTSVFFCAKNT